MSDNVALPPDDKLEEALALLAAGFSLDEALAEAGDDAEWLRPLLQTANEVAELAPAVTIPSPQASLARMLAHVDAMPVDRSNGVSPKLEAGPSIFDWLRGTFFLGARPIRGILIALVAAIVLMGSLTWTAQASLPGQALYPIKQLSEAVRLTFTLDPQAQTDLEALFNLRRQAEVRQLLARGQMAMISFTGRVTIISPTKIAVDGLELQLTALSQIEGDIADGAQVRVEVVTEPPARIKVLALTVLEPGLAPAAPTVTPSPSPTVTSEPTDVPDDTPTVTPEPTKTATATATATPTVTPIPPTRTPVPSPTATPSRAVSDGPFDNGGFDENFNDSFEDAPPEDGSNDNSNTADDSANENRSEDFADDNSNDSEFKDEEFADDNSGFGDSGGGNDNEDNSGSGNSNDNDDKDNSGSDSGSSGDKDDKDNSGSGSSGDDDNSGSGSDNSDSGSDNSGKGSSGSGSKDDD